MHPAPLPSAPLEQQLAEARARVAVYRTQAVIDRALGRAALATASEHLAARWAEVVEQLERLAREAR